MWPPLAAGAALHVPAAEVLASPADLLAWWAGEGITVAFLPTPLAEAVLAEPMPRDLALRVLLTGGDRLHRRPSADLPFALVNHYGPTECTVVTTAGEVASQGWRVPDIGAPIAHTQAHLLDRALRPVPVGIPGELCVAGLGLARGYRGRGELTAERFVPNPWADRRGERLYRTGDLARRLPDGRLEFLGRLDRQVKLRGFRIELGEIESALLAQPGIAAAAVVLREDRPGDKRLVAYVAASEGEPLAAGLRQALAQRLPDYMVPAVFVALRSLPLTPNGKIDLQALPAPDGERAGPGVDFVAPRHPVEEVLAAVWAEVLHAERVGIHDNFFALGGDSIRTIQVVARSRKQGIRVTAREIFQHQTIAELAAVAQVAAPPAVAVPEIPPSRTEAREAGALTPADFPVSRLDQTELDELLAELG
jgi:aryl carrier-like protein